MALYRIDHVSRWKEEMPSEAQRTEGIENLENVDNKVDCILTHCASTSIQDGFCGGLCEHDDLTDFLEIIRQQCSFII